MAWKYRFVIATCARWETPYVVEWLTYHRAIGFEHVYLYCNDDDPAALYEAVLPFMQGKDPFVTFRYFPEQGMQRKMLMHFCAHNGRDSEWVSFLDLDEFLRLPPGQTLPDYMRAFEDKTDCLMFNWVFFGPNGHAAPPKSVLRALTRRQTNMHPFTKLLFRSYILGQPELFQKVPDSSFIHRLSAYVDVDIRPMNVLGEDMTRYYDGFPAASEAWLHEGGRQNRIFAAGALVHHYAFRTTGAFQARVERGLGGDFKGQTLWGNVAATPEKLNGFLNSVSATEDRSLAAFWDELMDQSQGLNILAAPAMIFMIGKAAPSEIEAALQAGGRVVVVQPDARLYYALAARFAEPIAEGRLVLENFAPAPRGGEIALLTPGDGSRPYPVATISWEELLAKHGRPASVKMGAQIPGFPAMVE